MKNNNQTKATQGVDNGKSNSTKTVMNVKDFAERLKTKFNKQTGELYPHCFKTFDEASSHAKSAEEVLSAYHAFHPGNAGIPEHLIYVEVPKMPRNQHPAKKDVICKMATKKFNKSQSNHLTKITNHPKNVGVYVNDEFRTGTLADLKFVMALKG